MSQPHILVLGAGGSTGRELVAQALARGCRVIAADRHQLDEPQREGCTYAVVDVLDEDSLVRAVEGVDVVASAIGLPMGSPKTLLDPPPLFTEGTRNIIAAMRKSGVARLVVISATFVETIRRGPIWFEAAAMTALSGIFEHMHEMEDLLRAAPDIEWTAVRPGWLLDAPYTGDYTVSEDVIPEDHIRTRVPDLADFMLRCALDGEHVRATPAISRAEDPSASSPIKVVEELAD
ncbi:NAD(P)-dependent oxidoreductase [Acuticoccus sp.]|uniref:NAD(P)-dependent oxidoreductase n=1 Tax=Acuticoccus sp. TaxID=1904378 RepID=UPI003B52D835